MMWGGKLRRTEGEEKERLASYLNIHLEGDAFLTHLLPLDPKGTDVLDRFHDGILLCRLVCLAFPDSIVDSRINVSTESKAAGVFKAIENVNIALVAAEAAGLEVVNIGAGDVIAGRSASILGLSCQLIRVHRLAQAKLKLQPQSLQPHAEDHRQQADDSQEFICTALSFPSKSKSGAGGGGKSGGGEGWLFLKVFQGVPFTISNSPDEAYIAVAIQRSRRRVVEGRRDPTRFIREMARRRGRGAARTRHKARGDAWRSELAARSKVMKELAAVEEKEARRLGFGMGESGRRPFWPWDDLVSLDEACVGVAIQRSSRWAVVGRRDPTRFIREMAHRRGRGAVRTRHKARGDVWRSELTARSKVMKDLSAKEEKEARRLGFGMDNRGSDCFGRGTISSGNEVVRWTEREKRLRRKRSEPRTAGGSASVDSSVLEIAHEMPCLLRCTV